MTTTLPDLMTAGPCTLHVTLKVKIAIRGDGKSLYLKVNDKQLQTANQVYILGEIMSVIAFAIVKQIFLFGLRFYISVNRYGHVETISSPNKTFFHGKPKLRGKPVLHKHTLACNRQQPFLNQRKEENKHRNYFPINQIWNGTISFLPPNSSKGSKPCRAIILVPIK